MYINGEFVTEFFSKLCGAVDVDQTGTLPKGIMPYFSEDTFIREMDLGQLGALIKGVIHDYLK
jgi:hypothetical protein